MRFDNKVVMITGGSSGIGAACARQFRDRGAHVSIIDLISPASEDALVTCGDVCDPSIRERAVTATRDRWGRIDILVNNVGIGMYEPATRTPSADELRIFETNVFSAVALTQLVVLGMLAQREGSIANISSVGAYSGLPWSAAYCASKAAIHSYSESLRRELHGYGIHVATVVPGIVNTGFREHVIRGIAPGGVAGIRRSVSAEDVASGVVRALVRRKRRVFVPAYGWLFSALDFVLPSVMDAYIDRKWSAAEKLGDAREDWSLTRAAGPQRSEADTTPVGRVQR